MKQMQRQLTNDPNPISDCFAVTGKCPRLLRGAQAIEITKKKINYDV